MTNSSEHQGPVLMLVQGIVKGEGGTLESSPGMREYLRQLLGSGLYSATSGYYLFSGGRPIDVFEGDYPETGFTVIARFPSLEAARTFWYSETYQKIKALRSDACEVLVTVYPETLPPDYMEGRLEGNQYVNVPSFDHIRRVD